MRSFNAVILGAGGVGKSALTGRFIKNTFWEGYDPTIEEYYRKEVVLEGERSTLEVLDTAGAEQFAALSETYIKNGSGFILVFSLTQESTLKEVDALREEIYRIKGSVPIVVVGTKSDLAAEREVSQDTIQGLATKWGLSFYETSAKKGWHVNDVFEDLLRQMRVRYPESEGRKKRRRVTGDDKNLKCVVM